MLTQKEANKKMKAIQKALYLDQLKKEVVMAEFPSDIETGFGRLIIEGKDKDLAKIHKFLIEHSR